MSWVQSQLLFVCLLFAIVAVQCHSVLLSGRNHLNLLQSSPEQSQLQGVCWWPAPLLSWMAGDMHLRANQKLQPPPMDLPGDSQTHISFAGSYRRAFPCLTSFLSQAGCAAHPPPSWDSTPILPILHLLARLVWRHRNRLTLHTLCYEGHWM